MSDFTVKGRSLPAQVTKVAAGQEVAAIAATQSNGSDDVVFKVGGDHFVASGRGLNLKGIKANDIVNIGGKEGRVVAVDNQLNSFGEGILAWPGLVVGGGGAAYGVFGFVQGMMAGANMAGLGLIIAAGALVVGAAINLIPAAYGALRKVES